MNLSARLRLSRTTSLALAVSGALSLASCMPVDRTPRPTLSEVRSGTARGPIAEDLRLRPGEISARVDAIDRARREIRLIRDDGRTDVLTYDPNSTRVVYHGWDYSVENLEAGDRVAYQPAPRDGRYADTLRIQEPVQARADRGIARTPSRSARNDLVEGTVERINYELGIFDVRPRSGPVVTVSIPYNARPADIDNFRSLRRGDYVRVEGEFVNPESLQLLAFLAPR